MPMRSAIVPGTNLSFTLSDMRLVIVWRLSMNQQYHSANFLAMDSRPRKSALTHDQPESPAACE